MKSRFAHFFIPPVLLLSLLCACGQAPELPAAPLLAPLTIQSGRQRAAAAEIGQTRLLPPEIQGVNYYPRQTPWNLFWRQTPLEVIGQDFARIASLGLNTVRLFIDYNAFGGARLLPAQREKLQQVLQLAERHRLGVILTLFDQTAPYAPERRAEAEAHLRALVAATADAPALLAWDLKNESDSDYATYGRDTVKNWIRAMAASLQRLDSRHPVTAGYADARQMGPEAEALDYLTFHYYAPETDFAATVADLRRRLPGKPVMLGEFGYHTWQGRPGDPHPQAHQFNYFNAILAGAAKARLLGTLAWNLYDYPDLKQVPALQQQPVNRYLGLLDLADAPKPGVLALQQRVHAIDADTQGAVTPLTKSIELELRLDTAGEVRLHLEQAGQATRTLTFDGQAGLNSLRFQPLPAELHDLLILARVAEIEGPGLAAQKLILRRD